jgi:pyroglutamyl-peptidase
MSLTILLTGFGRYPGAPVNPTGPLVRRIARIRQPRGSGVRIVPHVFRTSYAVVDRELPKLITRCKPDALLMFGLAPKARKLRIETEAGNRIARQRDAAGKHPGRRAIVPGGPPRLLMPSVPRRLLTAIKASGLPAGLSHDAGNYLCNYLCWRAAEASTQPGGPKFAAFVHVPLPGKHTPSLAQLADAGAAMVRTIAAVCRK